MSEETLHRIGVEIEKRLEDLFEDGPPGLVRDLFEPPPSSMVQDQLRDLTLRAGKRIRPAMVVCGATLFEDSALESQAVLDASAAMELMHVYFLIHDDIMDEDETRRGGPSAHSALASRVGDRKLGRDLAILCGDLAMAIHEGLLAGMDAPGERRQRAALVFAQMHRDVIHGQAMDLVGDADAEEVARRKTASYTTVGPLVIGGAIGGANDQQLERLGAIGQPLGIAFQLRDDLLGVFGKTSVTGKPVGTDLLRGKRTFLVQEALRRSGPDGKIAIERVFGMAESRAVDVAAAVEALSVSGAIEACEQRMDQLVDEALEGLKTASYREEGARFLEYMARLLVSRRT